MRFYRDKIAVVASELQVCFVSLQSPVTVGTVGVTVRWAMSHVLDLRMSSCSASVGLELVAADRRDSVKHFANER